MKKERKVPAGKINWQATPSRSSINHVGVDDGQILDWYIRQSKKTGRCKVFSRMSLKELKDFETLNSAQAWIRKQHKENKERGLAKHRTYLICERDLVFVSDKMTPEATEAKIKELEALLKRPVAEVDTTGRTHRDVIRQFGNDLKAWGR